MELFFLLWGFEPILCFYKTQGFFNSNYMFYSGRQSLPLKHKFHCVSLKKVHLGTFFFGHPLGSPIRKEFQKWSSFFCLSGVATERSQLFFCINFFRRKTMFDFLNNSVMENRTRNKKTVRRLLDKIRRSLDHSVALNGGMTSLKFVYGYCDVSV